MKQKKRSLPCLSSLICSSFVENGHPLLIVAQPSYTPVNKQFAPENRPKRPKKETIVFQSSIFQALPSGKPA